MITVICGEDTLASRTYLHDLISSYEKRGYRPKYIAKDELPNLLNSAADLSLFNEKFIHILEGANAAIARKTKNNEVLKQLEQIHAKKDVDLLIWEKELMKRELKYKDLAPVKEFKLSASIFSLLDACTPGQLNTFVSILRSLVDPSNEIFILVMLQRHLRTLVAASQGDSLASLPPWQRGKVFSQARAWSSDKLLQYYEKILNIEITLKSGKTTYSVVKAIEILSVYYL